jgi:hypothetical protein
VLTEETKKKITEEEIFRDEVRKSLIGKKEANSSVRTKVWEYLNTNFTIWFLSTVVLGLAGWGYAKWQTSVQNADQIYKLDSEITARITSYERLVENRYKVYAKDPTNSPQTPLAPANDLLLAPNEKMVQPEFANRNLKSLLFELKGRVPESQKPEIDRYIVYLLEFEAEFLDKKFAPSELIKFIEYQESHIFEVHPDRFTEQSVIDRKLENDNYVFALLYEVFWWGILSMVAIVVIGRLGYFVRSRVRPRGVL